MPMESDLACQIVDLRTGGISEYDALAWAKDIEERLKTAIETSPLPERPGAIDPWLQEQYRQLVVR
jgi:hypothetical protein